MTRITLFILAFAGTVSNQRLGLSSISPTNLEHLCQDVERLSERDDHGRFVFPQICNVLLAGLVQAHVTGIFLSV